MADRVLTPEGMQEVKPFAGSFPELGPPLVQGMTVEHQFKAAYAAAENVLRGQHHYQNIYALPACARAMWP